MLKAWGKWGVLEQALLWSHFSFRGVGEAGMASWAGPALPPPAACGGRAGLF